MKAWKDMSPRAKQITVALAGAAILAVIALMSRRRGGSEAGEPGSGGQPPFGSTFADNGEAAAGLGSAITEGLGNVALGLDQVNQRLDDIPAPTEVRTETQIVEVPVQPTATDAVAIQSTPNGNQVRRRAANQFTQTTGTRKGRDYKVIKRGKKTYRFYESAPGKGDFGKRAKDKVAVTKPKPAAKKPADDKKPAAKKPAAKRPAPKPKPSSPSRKPSTATRAPAHKPRPATKRR